MAALNIGATFEGKLACAFKNDEEFSKFSPEHVWKSKNYNFDEALLFKVDEFKIYRGVLCHDNEE